MLKPLATAALTLCTLTASVAAHPGHHTAVDKLPNPYGPAGCAAPVETLSMHRIAETFRAMPQSTRMNLQHVLRHSGLYDGRSDGIWGPKTECAVAAVAARYDGVMDDTALVAFFEYMLDGGFVDDAPGTPNPYPHPGVLY